MNRILIFLLLMLVISSCGKDSDSGSTFLRQEQQGDLKGSYKAVLRPMNSTTSGWIPYGNVEISVDENNIAVTTYLDDDQSVTHVQSIHEGKKCPTIADDKNKDGVIDAIEAGPVVGKVLIPLDGDISSQTSGDKVHPIGSSFTYQRKAPLDAMMSDLYSASEVSNNSVRKLKSGETFNLTGKVILIHGTSASNKLPSSVQPHNGLPSHLSVPVVCGILRRFK